jgi:16S rRNA processing protein RimM
MQYIGTISSSRGLKGEIVLKDVPENISGLKRKSEIFIGYSASFVKQYGLDYFKKSNRKSFIKLKEINSETDIFDLKEKGIFTDVENIIIEKDSNLSDDIVGSKVINIKNNSEIGIIKEIWYVPSSNDVWLVETPEGELPIPVTKEVVVEKDTENSIIKINLIDGLMDLLEPKSDAN